MSPGRIVQPGEEDTIGFNQNGRAAGTISTAFLHQWLNITLEAKPTLAAADNTQSALSRGDAWSILQSLVVRADGSKPIKQLDPRLLWWANYIYHRGKPPVSQELGDTNIQNPKIETQLQVPFWMFLMMNQESYTLDPRDLDSLEVVANWNKAADVNSNITGWETEPTLTITSQRSEYASGETQYRYSLFEEFVKSKEITSTTPNFELELPTDGVVAGVIFEFTDGGADSSDILNRMEISSGGTTYLSYREQDLRMSTNSVMGLDRDFDGQNYNDLRLSNDNDVEGVYYWTPSYEGNPTKLIDTDAGDGIRDLKAVMDVSKGGGTTKCHAHIMQIHPAIESREGGVTFRQAKDSSGSGSANTQKRNAA